MTWPTQPAVLKEKPLELKPEAFFKPLKQMEVTAGLKVAFWGLPETGKSYSSMTFPEPIYIVDTELAAWKVGNQHFADKDIRIYEVKVVDPASELDKADPIRSLNNTEKAIISLKNVKEGTIVVDTITDYWAWMSAYVEVTAKRFYKKTGEMMRTEWGTANERFKYFIMRLLSMPVHVVLTAQAKRLYSAGGEELLTYGPKWMFQTPHWCDIVIHMTKMKVSETSVKYLATITKCRFQRAFNATIEDMTFDKLVAKLKEIGVKIKFTNEVTS